MTRTFLFTLFIQCFLAYSQDSTTCIVETFDAEWLGTKVVQEVDTILHCNCGKYQEFDSTGALLIEGHYAIVDSVQCKDCYDGHFSAVTEERNWKKYDYSKIRSIRIGEWKYFYQNGQLKMKGHYSKKVHESQGTSYHETETREWNGMELNGVPVNGWIDFQYLKDGIWTYFDESGNKTKVEDFIDGTLIYTKLLK